MWAECSLQKPSHDTFIKKKTLPKFDLGCEIFLHLCPKDIFTQDMHSWKTGWECSSIKIFPFSLDIFIQGMHQSYTYFPMIPSFKEQITSSWIWDVKVSSIFLPEMFSPKICINAHGFESRAEQTEMQKMIDTALCVSMSLHSMQTPFLGKNVNWRPGV